MAAAASHLARGLAVARAGAALQAEHGQREHRIAVAAVGGELVPLGGFGVVLRHAEPAGIKLAEQRHRLRIVLLLDALRRQREGGKIIAALERAEGEVGLRGTCGEREQCESCRCEKIVAATSPARPAPPDRDRR